MLYSINSPWDIFYIILNCFKLALLINCTLFKYYNSKFKILQQYHFFLFFKMSELEDYSDKRVSTVVVFMKLLFIHWSITYYSLFCIVSLIFKVWHIHVMADAIVDGNLNKTYLCLNISMCARCQNITKSNKMLTHNSHSNINFFFIFQIIWD